MKRHRSLVPLSHDHHHALVEARRLRRAAGLDDAGRRDAVAGFLRFFTAETVRHFREEEERVFPLLVDAPAPAGELVVQALLDHQRLHALVARLGAAPDADAMLELAETLEGHIRLEERRLFPLAEAAVPAALDALELPARDADRTPVVDLLAPLGRGPLWGTESEDLNATLLAWDAGTGTPEHVNSERDVVVLVLAGSASVTIDGEPHAVHAGDALIVEKGRSRQITAGAEGVRYVSVHRRRAPLQIASR